MVIILVLAASGGFPATPTVRTAHGVAKKPRIQGTSMHRLLECEELKGFCVGQIAQILKNANYVHMSIPCIYIYISIMKTNL